MCCTGVAIVMFLIAPLFPRLYNTDSTTRHLAEYLIMTQAVFMPQNAFLHATYFTLRSGGKTVITFFFDSVFIWIASVPVYGSLRGCDLCMCQHCRLDQMCDRIRTG